MLNLITESWIPVRRKLGADLIRPDQIAEPDILAPDWPRPDLNLACLELLVGLVYLACPPDGADAWVSEQPDAEKLRRALAPLAPAFELLGDGPRFLQDLEPLTGTPSPPDMLFIDSAGDNTAKKNADLMVRRARYPSLDLALAAMALYTLQAFAPSGGAGNRTSMRGGGPMVTLVRPEEPGLWPLIWANVPRGRPLDTEDLDLLPWMRPTELSDNKRIATPPGDGTGPPEPEVFFGMPRRLRLVTDGHAVTGVVQKPWGTNYVGWLHPLTPYYLHKTEKLPRHPKPGAFGYRNWRGVILQEGDVGDRPAALARFLRERPGERCDLIVAGWAMDNMKPLDFLWSEQPVFPLDERAGGLAAALVEAAEHAGFALAATVAAGTGEGELGKGAGLAAREAFFRNTQGSFEERVAALALGRAECLAESWLGDLRSAALPIFDEAVLPGLPDLGETRRRAAVDARRRLTAMFAGYPPFGKKLWGALGLTPPPRRKKEAA